MLLNVFYNWINKEFPFNSRIIDSFSHSRIATLDSTFNSQINVIFHLKNNKKFYLQSVINSISTQIIDIMIHASIRQR